MLLVQKYLETHTFNDLIRDHGVYPSFSASGHKWSLNYDMIEAKGDNPLAQECRGLILSCDDGKDLTDLSKELDHDGDIKNICPGDTVVLGYPFKRFFNLGMAEAANIDFADPETVIQTKYDGSLIIVYFDPFMGIWCVATRSSPDADIVMDNGIYSFRTLFEKTITEQFNLSFDVFTKPFDKKITYCFELMTIYNRVVVDYKSNNIVLLGARDLCTFKEIDVSSSLHESADPFRWLPFVEEYDFESIDDVINYINTKDPSEMEGVVIRDKHFNRIKIKSAAYVLAHKMKDHISSSPRNCLEAILSEKDDDIIPLLPAEVVANLLKMKENVKTLIKNYDIYYQILLNCANTINKGDKKTFALLVTNNSKNLWTAPLFSIFGGKSSSMKDFIQKNQKDGTWSNNFLDKILDLSKNCERLHD